MKFNINSKIFNFSNNISHHNQIPKSFNDLATKTFGLSFENWYQAGYWADKYIPYVLLDGNDVFIAIACVDYNWIIKKPP